jgi:hypothetical protein
VVVGVGGDMLDLGPLAGRQTRHGARITNHSISTSTSIVVVVAAAALSAASDLAAALPRRGSAHCTLVPSATRSVRLSIRTRRRLHCAAAAANGSAGRAGGASLHFACAAHAATAGLAFGDQF